MTDEKTNKKFVFLYPHQELFDSEIRKGADISGYLEQLSELSGMSKEEVLNIAANRYKKEYKRILNSCIRHRYRAGGFSIFYVLRDDKKISDIINLEKGDKIIRVDTNTNPGDSEDCPNPVSVYILSQLLPADHLRVAGFRLLDDVEFLAETAYKRGINTLVDEDLTDQLPSRILATTFKKKVYPSFDPRDHPRRRGEGYFEWFMEIRKGKPWMWQEY